jgi:E3 ubiquitin-protein ligase UBR1
MGLFMQSNQAIANPLAAKMSELLMDAWNPASPIAAPAPQSGVRLALERIQRAIHSPPVDGVASPVSPADASQSQKPIAVSPMKELVDIYRRLRDTMVKNGLPEPEHPQVSSEHSQNDLCHSDTLAQTLGISISSVEIQQRGVKSQFGMTLLDTIPQQAITHLRVLAESASSYVSIGGIKLAGDNRVAKEFCRDYERQYYQLFSRSPYPEDSSTNTLADCTSLFDQDIFVFLTQSTLCLAQVEEIETMHLVRLCYLAELVKVVLRIGSALGSSAWHTAAGAQDPAMSDSDHFQVSLSPCKRAHTNDLPGYDTDSLIRETVKTSQILSPFAK